MQNIYIYIFVVLSHSLLWKFTQPGNVKKVYLLIFIMCLGYEMQFIQTIPHRMKTKTIFNFMLEVRLSWG